MNQVMEYIKELHDNYNELGEDLLFLEAVSHTRQTAYPLPEDYVASSLNRLLNYIEQHTGEIQHLARLLCKTSPAR